MFLYSFVFLMLLGLSSAQTESSVTSPDEVETEPTMSTDQPETSPSVSTATEPTTETPPDTTPPPPDSKCTKGMGRERQNTPIRKHIKLNY
ncbi:ZP domain-containing protein [Acropora cervicornis]|uniref:ZP domain-containing protein n=1 Tax=Acropora cervicornis TaxID=6130 RepID=A0AAD9UVR9_ACRCE|nr:ZP domain-containing protein [Acropora cervicornis]